MSDLSDSENEALSRSIDAEGSSSSGTDTNSSSSSEPASPATRRGEGPSRLVEILQVGPTTRPDNRFIQDLGTAAAEPPVGVNPVAEAASERSAGQVSTSGRGEAEDPDSPPPAGEEVVGRNRPASRTMRINDVSVYRRSDQEIELLAGGRPVYSVDFHTSAVTPGYLATLRRDYQIPDSVELRAPGRDDLPSRPPPGFITLSAEYFRAGLRLPFHPYLRRALTTLNVAPAQLNANAYRILVSCFILWAKHHLEELPFRAFQNLYRMKSAPSSAGSYYFQGFKGSFITKCPDSDKQFKHLWFYAGGRWLHESLTRDELDPTERVPVVFRKGYVWTRAPHITEETSDLIDGLQELAEEARDHRSLLGETSLSEHGWFRGRGSGNAPVFRDVTVARMPEPTVRYQARTSAPATGVAPAPPPAQVVAAEPGLWGPRVADEDLDMVIGRLSPIRSLRPARGLRIQGRRRSSAEHNSRSKLCGFESVVNIVSFSICRIDGRQAWEQEAERGGEDRKTGENGETWQG